MGLMGPPTGPPHWSGPPAAPHNAGAAKPYLFLRQTNDWVHT
jgi:hypothetical protein